MDARIPFTIDERQGVLAGPVRRPENFSRTAVGSIHDDDAAQKLGFRGGTVAGNIHFEQFPPLMEVLFGEGWRRSGGLSLYFQTPTTDGEPVQAFARRRGATHAEVWMKDAAGQIVCEGSASAEGPDPDSALQRRLAALRPAQDLRIVRGSKVRDAVRNVPSRLHVSATGPRLAGITEPMDMYSIADAQGRLVAAPAVAIDALRAVEEPLFRLGGAFVGMFGAIELQFLNGPIFVEQDYLADGRVLGLSESPKTEVVWYESTLKDASDGREVARLIMMSRLLKASSPLWAEAAVP